jgi:hypothetical protein
VPAAGAILQPNYGGASSFYFYTTNRDNLFLGFTDGNVASGYSYPNPSGASWITAIGLHAGANVSSSEEDVLIGAETGHWITNGSNDVAVGDNSLGGNDNDSTTTSGTQSDDTVVGFYAGGDLTTGTYGALVGYWAGYNITTDSYNTALGATAIDSDTTGGDNIAVVSGALNSNVTGNYNTALGYFTLGYNDSATGTVAIGMNAARGTSAYNNQGGTTIGYLAGDNFQTGSNYNTLIGYYSGYNLTTGANNILMGAEPSSANANLTTGSNNIGIEYNISLASSTASGQLDIGNLIYGAGLGSIGSTVSTGNIGIGTSTPYSRLTTWGADTAAGTAALTISNSASTTELQVFDNGSATLAGTLTQNSDQRLKTNVQSLDASSSLSAVDALNPVTFNWIDPDQGTTPQLGFIAQQVQPLFPQLASTTSATALTSGGTLGLNYIGLISPIVSAIQALTADITAVENTIAGFAQSFVSDNITASNERCVGSTCVTPAQSRR